MNRVRLSLLPLLPLAAVALPVAVAPALPDNLLLIRFVIGVAPVLPFVAVPAVAALAYRWTGRATTAAWMTALAVGIGLLGGLVWMLAIWPTGH